MALCLEVLVADATVVFGRKALTVAVVVVAVVMGAEHNLGVDVEVEIRVEAEFVVDVGVHRTRDWNSLTANTHSLDHAFELAALPEPVTVDMTDVVEDEIQLATRKQRY